MAISAWFAGTLPRLLLPLLWLWGGVVLSFAVPCKTVSAADPFEAKRRFLVEKDIVGAGIKNDAVVLAIRTVPRHEFVLPQFKDKAYLDMALPIGEGQTISPPFIVAYMTESLDPQPTDKVLEIGTGSGYQAAILSKVVKEVYSIEIVEPLGKRAAKVLKKLKYANVQTKIGDGYEGWPEHAPFNKIIVTCSPEDVPKKLVEQLADDGKMIVPVGERYQQTLYLFRKQDGKLEKEAMLPTLFVPMTGQAEAERKVKPDGAHPTITNGGFEETRMDPPEPIGWYYLRQYEVVSAEDAPEGKSYVRFTNQVPGQSSQMLQGLAIYGDQVAHITIRSKLKYDRVKQGIHPKDVPVFSLAFFDEDRKQLGEHTMGPWLGSQEWHEVVQEFRVPLKAREMILMIGLQGATGELCLDHLQMVAIPRN